MRRDRHAVRQVGPLAEARAVGTPSSSVSADRDSIAGSAQRAFVVAGFFAPGDSFAVPVFFAATAFFTDASVVFLAGLPPAAFHAS
jgi:hypothetical protein